VRFVMFVPVTLVGLAVLIVRYGGIKRAEKVARASPDPDPGLLRPAQLR
jgi:hypothetical protein